MMAALALPTDHARAGSRLSVASKSIPTQNASRVDIDFSVGELDIVAIDGNQVHLEVEIRCKKGRDCGDPPDDVTVITETQEDEIRIRVKDFDWDDKDYHLYARIEVPRSLAVDVRMNVGELDIDGVEQDLDVTMSVGEVDVRVPESAVRSVDLEVSIGDAALRPRNGSSTVRGWLGKRVDWDRGKGRSRVDIDLSVGDATVTLL
jgi:hypothetical protein